MDCVERKRGLAGGVAVDGEGSKEASFDELLPVWVHFLPLSGSDTNEWRIPLCFRELPPLPPSAGSILMAGLSSLLAALLPSLVCSASS